MSEWREKMKKTAYMLIVCVLVAMFVPSSIVQAATHDNDMRAVWISTVYNLDYPSTKNNITAQQNEFIEKLTKELNDANYEIAGLKRELKKSRIRQNQRTFFLENRLDIAYTKLAQLKYTLDEFEELGFIDRVRGKKPESLDDIDI